MTGFRPATPEKVRKYDRLIFDITYNDWMGDRDPFKVKWNSIGFNINWMSDIPLSKKNTVAIGIGPSYSFQRIVHNENVDFGSDYSYTLFGGPWSAPSNWQRSLNVNEFSLPIELRFRTKGWKHFKFHIGGKIGYRMNGVMRMKYDMEGQYYTSKHKNVPDINHSSYSAHVRIGMRNWALFGSYNFSPLFSSDESSELYPIQMGLSISLF